MKAHKLDLAQRQEPEANRGAVEDNDLRDGADGLNANCIEIPRPLKAIREYCLSCCNGSPLEVRLCPVKSCSLWALRFGRKPTEEIVGEAGEHWMFPLEDPITVADFHNNGGTRLDAIERHCRDCSGNSQSAVKNCHFHTCELYPFRLHENPNRAMSPEQAKLAAERLRANVRSNRGS